MNLYIRLLLLLLQLPFRSRLDVLGSSSLRFHVLPNDLDLNMHMNNGRYLTIMDLGRIDFMARNGLLSQMIKHKLAPVLASVQTRYRLPLTVFQAYDLQTRLLGWDEKWFYIEQRFVIAKGEKKGAVAAIGLLKGCLYNPKTKQTEASQRILELAEKSDLQSPDMPEYLTAWIEAEDALKNVTAQNITTQAAP